MKINSIINAIILFSVIGFGTANAKQIEIIESIVNNLPSSPIPNLQTKRLDERFLSCKTDSMIDTLIATTQTSNIKEDDFLPKSMEYLNDIVQLTYNTMRNGVISYVTKEVALSLLSFNVDGFSAESIANFVSDGTKPYLPFTFANGVKITKVTPNGGTIIYRAEMPITKSHSLAKLLALAGKVSATTTICNDMEMVDDLLGRHIVIQYDYYDSNGVFFSSFTING